MNDDQISMQSKKKQYLETGLIALMINLLLLISCTNEFPANNNLPTNLIVALSMVTACPQNFVLVPADATDNYTTVTEDFCVAKYEMKNDSSGNAVSQVADVPWIAINRPTAQTKCQAMGTGYDLTSNEQWQTMARNIEIVASNWSGGVMGSGVLNHGHADADPGYHCSADNEYVETDCANSGNETDVIEKRTHTFSNGEVIWDLAGNDFEWLRDDQSIDYVSLYASITGDMRVSQITESAFVLLYGPVGDYTAMNTSPYGGLGNTWFGTGGAIVRGGMWGNNGTAGIYAIMLSNNNTTSSSGSIGFRCAYTFPP